MFIRLFCSSVTFCSSVKYKWMFIQFYFSFDNIWINVHMFIFSNTSSLHNFVNSIALFLCFLLKLHFHKLQLSFSSIRLFMVFSPCFRNFSDRVSSSPTPTSICNFETFHFPSWFLKPHMLCPLTNLFFWICFLLTNEEGA